MPTGQTWRPSRPPPPPPRSCSHIAQFYSAEQALFDAIGGFVLPSFFSNQHAAVIVATKPHLDAVEVYLRAQNLVPEMLKKRDQLILQSAEEILEYLLPNGAVDASRFHQLFGQLCAKLQKRYPRLLIYGELVNMLCEQGQHDMAYELEMIWEVFLTGRDASLLCGYNLNAFAADGLDEVFQRICRAHSHVTPADDRDTATLGRPEDQQMVLAMLQQKSIRLEAEMARRSATELALQDMMDHIGRQVVPDAVGLRDQMTIQPMGICATILTDGREKYYFNSRFLELTGLVEDQIVNSKDGWLQAVRYQDRDRVSHNLRFSDGKTRTLQYRLMHNNGMQRWVSGNTVSKASGYMHTVIDVTELCERGQSLPKLAAEERDNLDSMKPPSISSSDAGSSTRPPLPISPSSTTAHSVAGRDGNIAHELSKMSRFVWDLLQAEHKTSNLTSPYEHTPNQPPTLPHHLHSDRLLSNLHNWRTSLPDYLIPTDPEFRSANAPIQKANVRLTYIAYLLSVLLITREAIIEERCSGREPPLYDSDEIIRLRTRCLEIAWEAVITISGLLSEASNDEDIQSLQASRLAINTFLCASLVLYSIPTAPPSAEQEQKITSTQTLFFQNSHTSSLARRYAPLLSSPDTDFIALLKRPFCSAVFDPLLWSAGDLLQVPAAVKVGLKRPRQASLDSVESYKPLQGETSPGETRARPRAKTQVKDVGVSKELEALFRVH